MVVAPVLVEIGALALALACLAIALLIVAIMRKVGDLVRGIWLIGGTIAAGVDAVAQGITWVLGKAIGGVEAAIGASWHLLAQLWDELWGVIVKAATGWADLAELVAKLVYAHTGLRSLVHAIEHAWHGIEHGVRTLEKEYRGIEARVRELANELTNGIGHDLRIGLQKVEKTVNGIVSGTIPAIQRTIDGVSGELTQLEQFIKALPGVNYLDWAAGIVAAAVGIDILNVLRCPSFLRSARNRGCGLWNGLEDLLGLLFDALIFADLCDVLAEAVTLFAVVEAPLVELIASAADAVCAQPPAGWTTLPLVELPPYPIAPALTLVNQAA